MAEFLQQAPQFGFSLGLIELAIFRLDALGDGALLVQPRVVARTAKSRGHHRSARRFETGDVTITLPDETKAAAGRDESRGRIIWSSSIRLLDPQSASPCARFLSRPPGMVLI